MTLWQGLLAALGSVGHRFGLFSVDFLNIFVFLSYQEMPRYQGVAVICPKPSPAF